MPDSLRNRPAVERLEGQVRFNAPVYFTFDDATIRPEDRAVLDRFADVIESYYPDVAITAEGFTDSSGSAEYNKALGKRRADGHHREREAPVLRTRGARVHEDDHVAMDSQRSNRDGARSPRTSARTPRSSYQSG